MANEGTRTRRRRKSPSEPADIDGSRLNGVEDVTREGDIADVGRVREERADAETNERARRQTMASESQATLTSTKSRSRRTKEHRRGSEERRHRKRRPRAEKEDGADEASGATKANPPRRSGSDADSSEADEGRVRVKSKPRKVKVVYVTEVSDSSRKRQQRREKHRSEEVLPRRSEESIKRSRSHQTRRKSVTEAPHLRRSVSTKEISSTSRPTIKRSRTTSTHIPSSSTNGPTSTTAKRSSFIGGLFGGPPKPVVPEKQVECLTCLDDVPRSKAAKLSCGHRMCNSCLKRIFRLSITDPQHMPPKCCTADHIPLEHVDKLFDIKFKKTWNRKFQEFSTKNRIYCPARKCGEWIKPSHIHKKDGRKYGECSRCHTKTCCLCNGKWHGSKDCPNDEETNKLLDTAKEAGWQRCYSCRTMVELKEGCNHMTCHCTAQFCMICGLKWKTCNCPWFNYDAVEADRLEHMQIPVIEVFDRPNRLRRPPRPVPPNGYRAELEARRRQEREDEALARRLERAALDDEEDYQGGIGDIHGIGNGAGHFMNQNYVRAANILTGNYEQANAAANYVMGVRQARGSGPPPPRMAGRFPVPNAAAPAPNFSPPTRRQSAREVPRRPVDRPAPPRRSTDYEAAAPPPEPQVVRPAVLAGLAGRGGDRVSAWRNHVGEGAPEEGVLSV